MHIALRNGASVLVVNALIRAWPGALTERDKEDGSPRMIPLQTALANDAPDAIIVALLVTLQMRQFSDDAVAPFAIKAAKRYKYAAPTPTEILQSHARVFPPTATPATDAAAATKARSTFERMIAERRVDRPPSDTAPLSERLYCIRQVLNICLQTELSIAPANSGGVGGAAAPAASCCGGGNGDLRVDLNRVGLHAYMEMHVDPAISLVQQELESLKRQVAADPVKYRLLLADLSAADRIIYDESFGKTIKDHHGGDEVAYNTMCRICASLKSECTLVDVQQQPTSDLVVLVLMVRANIAGFKRAVEAAVEHAATKPPAFASVHGSSSVREPKVTFRHETKAPYRMIEKSLTKGPNKNYPDVSKVLDVFGCLIECADYDSMTAVIVAFADKHDAGELHMSRIKDRWTTPSSGGWRDLMLNLVVEGVVFEVQIVHSKMLGARKGMDAHKAYNQFRCFAEVFDLLGIPMLDGSAAPRAGSTGGSQQDCLDGEDGENDDGDGAGRANTLALEHALAAALAAAAEAEASRAVAEQALAAATAAAAAAAAAARGAADVRIQRLEAELARLRCAKGNESSARQVTAV